MDFPGGSGVIHLQVQETQVGPGKTPHGMEPLSPCATTTEPVLSSLGAPNTEAHHPTTHALWKGKPPQQEVQEPQLESVPHFPHL